MNTHCPGQLGLVIPGINYWQQERKFLKPDLNPISDCPHPMHNTVYVLGDFWSDFHPILYIKGNNKAGVARNVMETFAQFMHFKFETNKSAWIT